MGSHNRGSAVHSRWCGCWAWPGGSDGFLRKFTLVTVIRLTAQRKHKFFPLSRNSTVVKVGLTRRIPPSDWSLARKGNHAFRAITSWRIYSVVVLRIPFAVQVVQIGCCHQAECDCIAYSFFNRNNYLATDVLRSARAAGNDMSVYEAVTHAARVHQIRRPGALPWRIATAARRPVPGRQVFCTGQATSQVRGWVMDTISSTESVLREDFRLDRPEWWPAGYEVV